MKQSRKVVSNCLVTLYVSWMGQLLFSFQNHLAHLSLRSLLLQLQAMDCRRCYQTKALFTHFSTSKTYLNHLCKSIYEGFILLSILWSSCMDRPNQLCRTHFPFCESLVRSAWRPELCFPVWAVLTHSGFNSSVCMRETFLKDCFYHSLLPTFIPAMWFTHPPTTVCRSYLFPWRRQGVIITEFLETR